MVVLVLLKGSKYLIDYWATLQEPQTQMSNNRCFYYDIRKLNVEETLSHTNIVFFWPY